MKRLNSFSVPTGSANLNLPSVYMSWFIKIQHSLVRMNLHAKLLPVGNIFVNDRPFGTVLVHITHWSALSKFQIRLPLSVTYTISTSATPPRPAAPTRLWKEHSLVTD